MARLVKQRIITDKITFSFDVNITNDGMFTTTLPAEVVNKLEAAGIQLNRNQLKNSGYYHSDTMIGLCKAIRKDVDKYSERHVVSEEIVLRYQIETRCTYCKTKEGQIVPDGGWQQKIDGDHKWLGGTREMHATSRETYGLDVYVEPQFKTVYSFPDGSTHTDYRNLTEEEEGEGTTLHWLASVRAMKELWGRDIKDIKYTEEAGEFFKSLILFIIRINEKLQDVFGEKIDVSKAIESKKFKQLPMFKTQ